MPPYRCINMANCLWIIDAADPRVKTCSRPGCTNRVATNDPPERCFARCQAIGERGPCAHLGAEARRVGCDTCQGNVQVKLFACAVLGECTLAKAIDGLACCVTCERFESKA